MDKRSFQNVMSIFIFDTRLIYFIGFHSVAVYFTEDAVVLFLQAILKYTEKETPQRQTMNFVCCCMASAAAYLTSQIQNSSVELLNYGV